MVGIGPKGTTSLLRLLGIAEKEKTSALDKLASGKRINKAADDAAGLSIAEGLKASAGVADQAARNISSAVSLTQIRDSAASQLSEIEGRRGELAAQAANGTLSDTQRLALNDEYQALGAEAERIVASTKFNDTPVFSGESSSFQVGLNGDSESIIKLSGVDGSSLIATGDLLSQENALNALTNSKGSIDNISQLRGQAGATVSRIEAALSNVQVQSDNFKGAESRIRDADIAAVAADRVAAQIRTEFGISALQANNLNASTVLSLLR